VFQETHARSIAKALSWRVLGTLATAGLVFIFTRRLVLSLAVGGLEFVSKIGLFWFHERVWDRLRFGKKQVDPAVIWFTGLSGSGKSTIANYVADQLRHRGFRVERLDGDSVRHIFPEIGFTRPERDAHIRRVGFLAGKLEEHGVFVVGSFVSPYEESRQFVRSLCRSFIEVYVSTPLDECERRDVKGLYARARRGEIKNFTGISDPYEPPKRPELVIDTRGITVEAAGEQVLAFLGRRIPRTI
jgi:adenylylsulfate kinase